MKFGSVVESKCWCKDVPLNESLTTSDVVVFNPENKQLVFEYGTGNNKKTRACMHEDFFRNLRIQCGVGT